MCDITDHMLLVMYTCKAADRHKVSRVMRKPVKSELNTLRTNAISNSWRESLIHYYFKIKSMWADMLKPHNIEVKKTP